MDELESAKVLRRLDQEAVKKLESGATGSTEALPQQTQRRLIREMRDIAQNPRDVVDVYMTDNIGFWRVVVVGPEGTAYAGGIFEIWMRFPAIYPQKAPEVGDCGTMF